MSLFLNSVINYTKYKEVKTPSGIEAKKDERVAGFDASSVGVWQNLIRFQGKNDEADHYLFCARPRIISVIAMIVASSVSIARLLD